MFREDEAVTVTTDPRWQDGHAASQPILALNLNSTPYGAKPTAPKSLVYS
jgi:hypothetical protein